MAIGVMSKQPASMGNKRFKHPVSSVFGQGMNVQDVNLPLAAFLWDQSTLLVEGVGSTLDHSHTSFAEPAVH
jgi:hypothetical protein